MLKGRRFESIEAIKTNSLAHLHSIPKTAFQECFRTLKKTGSGAYRVEGRTLKATRLNSFKVRLENFYAIYSGIFRTDLVFNQQCNFQYLLPLYLLPIFHFSIKAHNSCLQHSCLAQHIQSTSQFNIHFYTADCGCTQGM